MLFRSVGSSKGLILYFHGNQGNLQRWGEYAVDFTSRGYDVLMVDYRGYGKSNGVPEENILYRDAEKVWGWATSTLKPIHTILYGRSLGSAIACQLATIHNPYRLILETPFDEITGTMRVPLRQLLTILPINSEFSNKVFIQRVACPITIIHGTDDWVVPLSSALQLKPLLKSTDQFVIIEGGGHRNLREFADFHEALAKALP